MPRYGRHYFFLKFSLIQFISMMSFFPTIFQLNKFTVNVVVDLLQSLMPSIVEHCQKTSPLGSTQRATQALESLKTTPKIIEITDQLMVSPLASYVM